MNSDLRSRLGRAEDDLLSSILAGKDALSSWGSEWSALVADLSKASSSGATTVTVAVGDAVVSKVATIAKCFLDVGRKDADLLSKLQVDVDEILSSTHSLHLSPSACSSTPRTSKADSFSSKNSSVDVDMVSTAFVGPACRWLLQHIHNPYPSHQVKRSLAHASGCSLNTINSWFTNVRKRMGWTSICREFFHGCRADAVDAAFRALVQDDPDRPVGEDLSRAFGSVKLAAEKLYSSTFIKSAPATGLDTVVKDTTDCGRRCGDPGFLCQLACNKADEKLQSCKGIHGDVESVNTGGSSVDACSMPLSPTPSLTDDDSGGDEDVLPAPVAGKKRRVISENHADMSSRADRPRKRLRAREYSATSLRTPHNTPQDSKDSSRLLVSTPPHHVETACKQWLPEVDVQGLPKDFFGPNIGPRIHAVSDPLPRSTLDTSNIDEWFNAHFTNLFEFPPSVSTELDQTLPWEVELYHDYSIPSRGDDGLQTPDNSSSAVGMPDTLPDLITCENDLQSLIDSHRLGSSESHDVPPPATSPNRSNSPDSSIPTLSPIIDWAHLFGSSADVVNTTILHPQLGDSRAGHHMSSISFLDDDIFASTSMLLAS